MSTNDYATTSCSGQYYQMFIQDDQETFDKRKKLIDGTLKPEYTKTSEADRLSSLSLYSAKGQYMTAQLKNSQFNKMIEDLLFQKKVAEDNARKSALAKGMSIEEANRQAELAGKSVQTQINSLLYTHSQQMTNELTQSKTIFQQKTEENSTAHSQYMSADIELGDALFRQQMLASNINNNTSYYNFLQQVENRSWNA